MPLEYLLFDVTDEEDGACSLDAMAVVAPHRLAPLLQEVEAVLGWAAHAFGPPGHDAEAGEWRYDLQAAGGDGAPLAIAWDAGSGRVQWRDAPAGRTTLTLTLGGTAAFGAAFREAFPDDG